MHSKEETEDPGPKKGKNYFYRSTCPGPGVK